MIGGIIPQEYIDMFLSFLDNTKVKAKLSEHIRVEIDNMSNKYNGSFQSFKSLTSGDVNLQNRLAVSSYDVYGRHIMGGNKEFTNNNTYSKMKRKIKYGKVPQQGYISRGKFTIG